MKEIVLDRINQAYKGELGKRIQEDAEKRIQWICSNVAGMKILDVGCSQGITSLLLGRLGKNVIGVDIIPEQIDYARNELANESEFVQNQVRFCCGDFSEFDFGKEKFDTIIMGECLEHVYNPTAFLDRAKNLLNERGKLIVTVPFGINPFPDHKRTYYFLELYSQINKRIFVSNVEFFGSWIGFVADKTLGDSNIRINLDFIEQLEKAFFSIDEKANEKISNLLGQINIWKEKNQENKSVIKDISKALISNSEIFKELQDNSENLNLENDKLLRENRQRLEEICTLEEKIEKQKELIGQKDGLIEKASIELTEYMGEKQKLERTIYNLKIEREKLETQIQYIKGELESQLELLQEKDSLINKTFAEISNYAEKQQQLENVICNLNIRHTNFQSQMESQLADLIDRKRVTEILARALADNTKIVNDAQAQHAQLEYDYNRLNDEKNELHKQLETISKDMEISQNENSYLKEELQVYNNQLYVANKKNSMYERLVGVKIYNSLRKIKRNITSKHETQYKVKDDYFASDKQNNEVSDKKQNFPTIDVIVPTYKENDYIEECILSVLNQNYPAEKLHIIIATNGSDTKYFKQLHDKYIDNKRINIVHTEKKGAAEARNIAIIYAHSEYIYFLDDDDFLTPNLLRELANVASENVDIVCGKFNDLTEKGEINTNTYINNAMLAGGSGVKSNYHIAASLFTTLCGKLYKTELLKNDFSLINVGFDNTEDIVFWAENAYKMKNPFYICSTNSEEAYMRRITEDSLSRPDHEKAYKFYIEDRLKVIEYIEQFIFNEKIPVVHKRFVLVLIRAQEAHMLKGYNEFLNESQKQEARELIYNSVSKLLNKGKFSDVKGVAFCHNFAPYIDASSYVATKRLSELSEYMGVCIGWDVICSDMSAVRVSDPFYDMFYAQSQYNKKSVVGKAYWNEKAQYDWGKRASDSIADGQYQYIYSRSMWPASHIAAYFYKQKNPNIIWIAECSDPIYMDINGEPRKSSKLYTGKEEFLNDFWLEVECMVFNEADKIVFTNSYQSDYMLEHNPQITAELNDAVNGKKVILNHPLINQAYCSIINSNYHLDMTKINVGYFGNFYSNRKIDDVFKLLKNEDVVIHVFTTSQNVLNEYVEKYDTSYRRRIIVNDVVSNLEFINIASKMSYLYLNDVEFRGEKNPYLPSKLADYLSTGTKVIAKINGETPMNSYQHENIIKIHEVDDDFALSLQK